jgi:hypothetical protein
VLSFAPQTRIEILCGKGLVEGEPSGLGRVGGDAIGGKRGSRRWQDMTGERPNPRGRDSVSVLVSQIGDEVVVVARKVRQRCQGYKLARTRDIMELDFDVSRPVCSVPGRTILSPSLPLRR